MTVAAIIQARMNSSRLRGKVLKPMAGVPMLQRMLERVRLASRLDALVVATTISTSDQPIFDFCEKMGIRCFRGDEDDVLSRYVGAAESCGADTIVRLTADCPMMDPTILDEAVAQFAGCAFDYVSNVLRRTYPNGLDVEIFSRAALQSADREARGTFYREHVTPYMRTGNAQGYATGKFRVGHVEAVADFSHLRWTVDTPSDFEAVERLVIRLPDNFHWLDAVALSTRDPSLIAGPLPPDPDHLALRPAEPRDAALVFSWVNAPDSLSNKLVTREPIPWRSHRQWFDKRLTDGLTQIWIAEAQRNVVGQIRFTLSSTADTRAEVDIYVTPEARGRGIGQRLIEKAISLMHPATRPLTLVARILPGNAASLRLFQAAGFTTSISDQDHLVLERVVPAAATTSET